MTSKDTTNACLVGGLYFALISFLFNLMAKYFLFVFKPDLLFPLLSTSLLSLVLGGIFGHLFGHRLALLNKRLPLFVIGALLAFCILVFYALGLQFIYYLHDHTVYNSITQWQDYFVLYGVILLFVILVAGIWFIPLLGLAAIHFNRQFLPGYQAYLTKLKETSP